MAQTQSILVVDDDESWLDFCVAVLAREGYQVSAASNGLDALPRLKSQRFDVVLTDHVAMPRHGSMVEAIASMSPETAVIVMTAKPSVEDAVAMLRRGAADYLEKPFSFERLRQSIRACLETRAAAPAKTRREPPNMELLGELVEQVLRRVVDKTQSLYDPRSNRFIEREGTPAARTTTLGRYEIIKELGRGAMGRVYLGRDPRINRFVALKTLPPALYEPGEGELKKRFFREAEMAGRLSHPSIVKIFDVGEEQGAAYIAMEFLEGKDLAAFTSTESLLPAGGAVNYARQAALALDYAHSQGVVHRDVKPANLMVLNSDLSLRVTDFGIAGLIGAGTSLGGVVGTPYYMSPERVAGRPADGRSDLFSLGVVLFELLTGQKPWKRETVEAVLYEVANEPHRSLVSVRPDLPPELSAVIDKALAKSPDTRYQTGAQFAEDLAHLMGP